MALPQRETEKSDGAFRTIAEVSSELNLEAHVLRFWETKFSKIKPMKLRGGRRYYRPQDIEVIRQIRDLLYERGYTIRGVQKLLSRKGDFELEGVEANNNEPQTPEPVAIEPAVPAVTEAEIESRIQQAVEAVTEKLSGDYGQQIAGYREKLAAAEGGLKQSESKIAELQQIAQQYRQELSPLLQELGDIRDTLLKAKK